MKNLFITLLITTTLVGTSLIFPNQYSSTNTFIMDEKTDRYNIAYNDIFNNMMKNMKNATTTGNVNLDFLTEMIPHHKGGIDMSKAIIQYGSNPEVKIIAKKIITSQEAEIPLMQELKSKFKNEPSSNKEVSENYITKYKEINDKMMKEMQSVKVTNNADTAFLQQMIYHHKGAINMAKNILTYTKDSEIEKFSKNIISTQSKDISEMESLLKELQNN